MPEEPEDLLESQGSSSQDLVCLLKQIAGDSLSWRNDLPTTDQLEHYLAALLGGVPAESLRKQAEVEHSLDTAPRFRERSFKRLR